MQIQPPKSIYLLLIDPAPPLNFVSGRRRGFDNTVSWWKVGLYDSQFDKIRPFWNIQDTFGVVSKMDQKSQFLTISPSRTIICAQCDMRGHFLMCFDRFGPSESVYEWFWRCTKKVDFWPFLLCFLGEKWPFTTIRGQVSSLNNTQLTVKGSIFDKIRPFWDTKGTFWVVSEMDKKSQFLTIFTVFFTRQKGPLHKGWGQK